MGRESGSVSKLSIADVVKATTGVIAHQPLIVGPSIHPQELPARLEAYPRDHTKTDCARLLPLRRGLTHMRWM